MTYQEAKRRWKALRAARPETPKWKEFKRNFDPEFTSGSGSTLEKLIDNRTHLSDLVMGAFNWNGTSQGYEVWEDLYDFLEDSPDLNSVREPTPQSAEDRIIAIIEKLDMPAPYIGEVHESAAYKIAAAMTELAKRAGL